MEIVFEKLPKNLQEMKELEYASLAKPEYAPALFLAAMKAYVTDKEAAYEMIRFLQGPREFTGMDKQFLKDRMCDKADYIVESYFKGSTVENNYTPSLPYTVSLTENPYSYSVEGYVKLFLKSAGADSARPVTVRHKPSTGQWFLWEQSSVLMGIRIPVAKDPWA